MARCTLFAVLAAGFLALPACGDDNGDGTTDTTQPTDTMGGDTTDDTTNPTDTSTTDTSADTMTGDTTGDVCGDFECGTVAGVLCGECNEAAGEVCNAQRRCVIPGAPLGSYCGITATCTPESASWPGCLDDQCESRSCISNSGVINLGKDICSQGCGIYKDSNGDGVNDEDAPLEDCNPDDVVDGPAGDVFRCVNVAEVGGTPNGICLPGTNFNTCSSDLDCADGEGCELLASAAGVAFRCMTKTRAGDWGGVAMVGETCNNDPAEGPIALCETGLCLNGATGVGTGIGCLSRCGVGAGEPTPEQQANCDTTLAFADTGCDTTTNTCMGRPERACTADVDCSSWECAPSFFTDLPADFRFCFPKSCDTNADCGGAFYCDLSLDTADDHTEQDPSYVWAPGCAPENPDGVDLGEACDPDPTDTVAINGGAECKSDALCIEGQCSALCLSDDDCTTDQICSIYEVIADVGSDGINDYIPAISWCTPNPAGATACLNEATCESDETCSLWVIANPSEDADEQTDSPQIIGGACVPAASGATGGWGAIVDVRSQCKTGLALSLTNGQFLCTETCSASSACEEITLGQTTYRGICFSQAQGYGFDPDNDAVNVYSGICFPEFGSAADCATDFTCSAAEEACIPLTHSNNPADEGSIEYVCSDVADNQGVPPSGQLNDACNPDNTSAYECASGLCLRIGTTGTGYCSALCRPASEGDEIDPCTAEGMTCTEFVDIPRQGFYAENSVSYYRCERE